MGLPRQSSPEEVRLEQRGFRLLETLCGSCGGAAQHVGKPSSSRDAGGRVGAGGLDVCISDELPGDADAAGLGTTLGKPWLYPITQVYPFHDKSLFLIIFPIIHTFISACPHPQ